MQRANQLVLDFAQTLGARAASAARFERFARLLAAVLQNPADDLDARGPIRRLIVGVRTPRGRKVSLEARSIKGCAGVDGSRTTSGLKRNVIHNGLLMNASLCFDNVPNRASEIAAAESLNSAQTGRRSHVDLREIAIDDVDADEDEASAFELRADRR